MRVISRPHKKFDQAQGIQKREYLTGMPPGEKSFTGKYPPASTIAEREELYGLSSRSSLGG